ncbi:MAG: hypothetical protein NC541_01480 [bacterium]|nr:hypothetical protein [bacterium]
MKLIFLLEEQSMKYFLDGLLPRVLPAEIQFITIPHEGKSDLQKSLTAKLKGWNEPNVKFVVVQDQDSNDCKELKEKLLELCKGSNKEVLVRIACHELVSWYFGDIASGNSSTWSMALTSIQPCSADQTVCRGRQAGTPVEQGSESRFLPVGFGPTDNPW